MEAAMPVVQAREGRNSRRALRRMGYQSVRHPAHYTCS